ncbi:MAG TPA: hypothetical protein VGI39_16875 [Polyangiaceae bacterium]|jgi:hypothetical protein
MAADPMGVLLFLRRPAEGREPAALASPATLAAREAELADIDGAMGAQRIYSAEEIRVRGSNARSELTYRIVVFEDARASAVHVGFQEIQWEDGEVLTPSFLAIDDEQLDDFAAAFDRARAMVRARKAATR